MKNPTHEPLAELAAHLYNLRETILRRWRAATVDTPGITIASTLTRVQFNDHIPGLLDAYGNILQAWPDDPGSSLQLEGKEQSLEHGLHRWQQGYQLRDLTREWSQLHMCVMRELDDYTLNNPQVDPAVMIAARQAWSKLCWDGISDSSTQYWRLDQTEATGHVRDLQEALSTLSALDQARNASWRETVHDLQGGLSLVTLASSVLEREDLSISARYEFSDLVQRGVSSLHHMLNDFMSLARLDAGLEHRSLSSFDAVALLRDFCNTSQPLASSRGLFLKMRGPKSMQVEGDPGKILRILQNLLLNALKFTERGGVTVFWDYVATDNWMFCVQDTGPGLDDDADSAPLAHHMHEATQCAQSAIDAQPQDAGPADLPKPPTLPCLSSGRPAAKIPAEGVGLSIVKRLCELLNASIELETSPGKGSTFRVTLPSRYMDDMG